MVVCPTTGDDVSRSLFDWADRSLFTRTRPIDSVLQVWLTRAESASAPAQLQLRAFLNNCWAGRPGQRSWAERLIWEKAGTKRPKNLWNYMHLSVLQGKTSLLQIVIPVHLFLLLFHCVYFLFCWPFQLNLSFDFDLVIRVVCFVCIGPFLFASYKNYSHSALRITNEPNTSARINNGRRLWSAHTQYIHAYVDNGRRLCLYEVKITRTLHSFHTVNKTRCDVKFVKIS